MNKYIARLDNPKGKVSFCIKWKKYKINLLVEQNRGLKRGKKKTQFGTLYDVS